MLWWGILPGCQPHSSHSCHELAVLCCAPPGSTSPWAAVLLGLQGWGTPGCCGGPCARAGECWGPICWGPICWGPDIRVGRAGISGGWAALRGTVQHNPLHPPWSSFSAPTPPISCTSHPGPHTLVPTPRAVGGPQPWQQDRAMGVAPTCPHTPGRQRQAVLRGALLPLNY